MVQAGIFIGGRATRMGGVPKGLLVTPSGETIVARWIRVFEELGICAVLVGEHAAYAGNGLVQLRDDPHAEGPLAGLLALLEHASTRLVVAVAGDMPYVSIDLVRRLMDARPATIVAARRRGRWEPFFARYDASAVLPIARAHAAAGRYALQSLLDECHAAEFELRATDEAELRDWDSPEDMASPG